MSDSSNTVPKQLKPFVKGDPRINRKGRPKTFDALRDLAKSIAHEPAKSGEQPIIIDGHKLTIAEAIMRSWATSKNPILQQKFIEVAFGKVPDEHKITGVMELLKGYGIIDPDNWDKTQDSGKAAS